MDLTHSLIAFTLAAALVTLAPGLDTALVLRTAAREGRNQAMAAAVGVVTGCFVWGVIVACGLGALLAASEIAYAVLKWLGTSYLFYLGLKLLVSRRAPLDIDVRDGGPVLSRPISRPISRPMSRAACFRTGFLTNILNPKVGVFYVSFLPQFIPAESNVAAVTITLAAIHMTLSLIWFAALIGAAGRFMQVLRPRAATWLDRITGSLFIAFGIRLTPDSGR